MNEHNIVSQAHNIFDSLEKWDAFFEIEEQIPKIIDHWLTIGSKALREHFKHMPSPHWKCSVWGDPRDSRWHLVEFGEESIGIGFGWSEWELHLHVHWSGLNIYNQDKAIQLLDTSEFSLLRSEFFPNTPSSKRKAEGSIAWNPGVNPYGDTSDSQMRMRIIAWYAAHNTNDFVEKMAMKVRQITENKKISELIRDLNTGSLRDTLTS